LQISIANGPIKSLRSVNITFLAIRPNELISIQIDQTVQITPLNKFQEVLLGKCLLDFS